MLPNKRTEARLATAEDILWLLLETTESLAACTTTSLKLKDAIFIFFFLLCLHSAQTMPE